LDRKVGRLCYHYSEGGFEVYLRKVVEKLDLPDFLVDEANLIEKYTAEKIIVAIFLECMCSAVVESLIVLDRWISVREKSEVGYVGLHRVFDLDISSTGWALVASR
jgi:hypothetical protein